MNRQPSSLTARSIAARHARRLTIAGVSGALGVALAAGILSAHAVVYPRTSTPGAYERYVLRVPNEKDVATTKVEIRFPPGARVVSFGDVPGWELRVIKDSAEAITGAEWSGSLAAARFVEFPFIAVNPKTAATLVWPVYQTYASGERVEWTGAAESSAPASSTVIADAASSGGGGGGGKWTSWAAWIALIVSIMALGAAIRKPAET